MFFRDVSSNIAVPSTSDGNAYVFLCYQNNQGGVVGIAWVRGTCSGSRFARSSVNEYLSNDVVTASVSIFQNKGAMGKSQTLFETIKTRFCLT